MATKSKRAEIQLHLSPCPFGTSSATRELDLLTREALLHRSGGCTYQSAGRPLARRSRASAQRRIDRGACIQACRPRMLPSSSFRAPSQCFGCLRSASYRHTATLGRWRGGAAQRTGGGHRRSSGRCIAPSSTMARRRARAWPTLRAARRTWCLVMAACRGMNTTASVPNRWLRAPSVASDIFGL